MDFGQHDERYNATRRLFVWLATLSAQLTLLTQPILLCDTDFKNSDAAMDSLLFTNCNALEFVQNNNLLSYKNIAIFKVGF